MCWCGLKYKSKELSSSLCPYTASIGGRDIMCNAMHADVENKCALPANEETHKYTKMEQSYIDEYSRCLELEADLSKKNDMVEKVLARALKSSDNALDYACKFTRRIQELLVYVSATCPSSRKESEKLVAVTPMNKKKQVRFAKPSTSARVYISTHASGSKPKGNTRNNRISRTSSSNQKNKKVEDQPKNAKTGLNKKNHISNYNASTKHAVLNVNSEFMCSACNEC
ncbi:hypothetical protein Tco_0648652 [Tanacetum coccineum]